MSRAEEDVEYTTVGVRVKFNLQSREDQKDQVLVLVVNWTQSRGSGGMNTISCSQTEIGGQRSYMQSRGHEIMIISVSL